MKNIEELYQIFLSSTGVCTDTRKIKPGNIFFALKGPNFNGNKFAEKALEDGAKLAVIDEEEYAKGDAYFLTSDVLATLQQLANHHRKQLDIPFLAITGSNGKTTTKELIKAVLSTTYRTFATEGNLNNHIGIPLTLLSINKDIEIAVIEMGANHQKEIESYCKVAEPTHGIITNIGKAHLEGFGGFEGVKKGKGELYQYIHQTQGTAFINSTNSVLQEISPFDNAVTYPQGKDFYSCDLIDASPFVTIKSESGNTFETRLIGKYNFENIAAALCIGKYFKVELSRAEKAVAEYTPSSNRSQIIKKNGNTIILDAYNANPSSMREAIENFASMPADKKKAVILGDMNELGNDSEREHTELGKLIAEKNFDKAIFCGEKIKKASEQVPGASCFRNTEEVSRALDLEKENYFILIKGSRSGMLEKIAEFL